MLQCLLVFIFFSRYASAFAYNNSHTTGTCALKIIADNNYVPQIIIWFARAVDEPGLCTFARPVPPGRQTIHAIKRHPGGPVKRKLRRLTGKMACFEICGIRTICVHTCIECVLLFVFARVMKIVPATRSAPADDDDVVLINENGNVSETEFEWLTVTVGAKRIENN